MLAYLLHLLVMIGIFSLLAYSLNLLLGFGGLLSFCHAALYGLGAYAYTLASIGSSRFGSEELLITGSLGFLPALLLAALVTSAGALLIAWLSLRFRGDTFIFATLGFQMIVYVLLYNWSAVTRGAFGIFGVPRPTVLGFDVHEPVEYLLLVSSLAVLICLVLFLIYRSPFGLSLKALREDERAAESLGVSAFWSYLTAFGLSGACAGIAGALFASYVTYVDPTSFSLGESIFLVTLVLLGGSGNIRGPLAGVLLMVLLPELLRFAGLPSTAAPNVREILYGAILIVLMYFRPQGLAGEYRLGGQR